MNGKATRPSLTTKRPWLHRARSRMGPKERMTRHQLEQEAKAANLPELMEKAEKRERLFPEGDNDA